MAGQEDEPQDVVLDVVHLAEEVGHLLLLTSVGVLQLRDLVTHAGRAPKVVDAASLRDGHQPRTRVLRDPGRWPLLERCHECVLRQVLGEVHIPGHPGQSTDEAGRLGPPRGEDSIGRVIRSGLCRNDASVVSPVQASGASGPVEIWRIVEITVTSGQYFACSSANSRWSATASSRVSYCMMAHPPTTSLASAYGPSTRVTSPCLTTKFTASSVPYRPPPSRNTPFSARSPTWASIASKSACGGVPTPSSILTNPMKRGIFITP